MVVRMIKCHPSFADHNSNNMFNRNLDKNLLLMAILSKQMGPPEWPWLLMLSLNCLTPVIEKVESTIRPLGALTARKWTGAVIISNAVTHRFIRRKSLNRKGDDEGSEWAHNLDTRFGKKKTTTEPNQTLPRFHIAPNLRSSASFRNATMNSSNWSCQIILNLQSLKGSKMRSESMSEDVRSAVSWSVIWIDSWSSQPSLEVPDLLWRCWANLSPSFSAWETESGS